MMLSELIEKLLELQEQIGGDPSVVVSGNRINSPLYAILDADEIRSGQIQIIVDLDNGV